MASWKFQRADLSPLAAGLFFMGTWLFSCVELIAPKVAELISPWEYDGSTHMKDSLCLSFLIVAAFVHQRELQAFVRGCGFSKKSMSLLSQIASAARFVMAWWPANACRPSFTACPVAVSADNPSDDMVRCIQVVCTPLVALVRITYDLMFWKAFLGSTTEN